MTGTVLRRRGHLARIQVGGGTNLLRKHVTRHIGHGHGFGPVEQGFNGLFVSGLRFGSVRVVLNHGRYVIHEGEIFDSFGTVGKRDHDELAHHHTLRTGCGGGDGVFGLHHVDGFAIFVGHHLFDRLLHHRSRRVHHLGLDDSVAGNLFARPRAGGLVGRCKFDRFQHLAVRRFDGFLFGLVDKLHRLCHLSRLRIHDRLEFFQRHAERVHHALLARSVRFDDGFDGVVELVHHQLGSLEHFVVRTQLGFDHDTVFARLLHLLFEHVVVGIGLGLHHHTVLRHLFDVEFEHRVGGGVHLFRHGVSVGFRHGLRLEDGSFGGVVLGLFKRVLVDAYGFLFRHEITCRSLNGLRFSLSRVDHVGSHVSGGHVGGGYRGL